MSAWIILAIGAAVIGFVWLRREFQRPRLRQPKPATPEELARWKQEVIEREKNGQKPYNGKISAPQPL